MLRITCAALVTNGSIEQLRGHLGQARQNGLTETELKEMITHLAFSEGRGRVQVRGQQITELNPGDVVFAPKGEEHWHGASPDHLMTHLSITVGAPLLGAARHRRRVPGPARAPKVRVRDAPAHYVPAA
jgi:Carboxymuconolactone decarboxylase family